MRDTSPRVDLNGKVAIVYPLLDCNARCPFCSTRVYTAEGVVSPVDHMRGAFRPIKDYTLGRDEMFDLYRALSEQGIRRINLQGGEPTILPYLLDLLSHGKALGFEEQFVITNGRRFADMAFARAMVGSSASGAGFSIYGATPEVHDESLGVRHAFEDMLAGVRNLRELGAFEIDSPFHCTAQLTVHARNVHQLPDMMRLWHGEGFRALGIRLLRDTVNTRGREDAWFFDLARLKAPLEEMLDYCLQHPEMYLSFSEVFYCLLDEKYLGMIWADRLTNPGLHQRKVQVTKHFEAVASDLDGRLAYLRQKGIVACERCDLAIDCVRVDKQYLDVYSGELAGLRVVERYRALVEAGPARERFAHLVRLVALDDEMAVSGVPAALRQRLRGALLAYALATPEVMPTVRAPELLFTHDGVHRARELLAKTARQPQPPIVRVVTLGELAAAGGPSSMAALDGDASMCAGAPAPELAALWRAERVITSALMALFTHGERHHGQERVVITAIHDERLLDRATVEGTLASLLSEPGESDLVALRARFAEVAVERPTPETLAAARELVGKDRALALAIVPEARRLALRRDMLRQAEQDPGYAPLAPLLFDDNPYFELRSLLHVARERGELVQRFIARSDLGSSASLVGEPAVLVREWAEGAPPERRAQVAALEGMACLMQSPVLVALERREPVDGREAFVVTTVYDDRYVGQALIERAYAAIAVEDVAAAPLTMSAAVAARAPASPAPAAPPGARPLTSPGAFRSRYDPLVSCPLDAAVYAELSGMLHKGELLAQAGVDEAARGVQRARLVRWAAQPDSPAHGDLVDLLLPTDDEQMAVRDQILFGRSRLRPPLGGRAKPAM